MKTDNHLKEFGRMFTVWRFVCPENGHVVKAKHSEIDDERYQHEYQTIIWQGMALSPDDALLRARK
jgi:hypothetical protein